MAGVTVTERPAPVAMMQGVAVPASSVRPAEFFSKTRRHILLERQVSWSGQSQDVFELRKSDILSSLLVRFSGSLVVTPSTGSVASTARWPYDLIKQCRFSANGASNIINCSGAKLKVRDVMKRSDLTDRGVERTWAGATVRQGTLSQASESWGVGSASSALAGGTYPVELEWTVPVAEDEIDLAGAIFLATSSTDLTLTLDWEAIANLFTVVAPATVSLTGTVQVISTKFSIPIGADGQIVVPALNVFHSLIQSRTTAIQTGENEVRLVGQGAGKSLLRAYYQLWNGAAPQTQVPLTAANFGKQSWRYGNNETPDEYIDGTHLRMVNERNYNADIGVLHGFGCHEFASENAFRDVVDMGTTSELRLAISLASGLALTNPALEYVTETVFLAGATV